MSAQKHFMPQDCKHIPHDIKHNRLPAPGLSFTQPNLPGLIQEIEALIEQQARIVRNHVSQDTPRE